MSVRRGGLSVGAAISAACFAVAARGQSFTDLGAYPGNTATFSRGVSADGSVVVGQSFGAAGNVPWRWTQAGGMQSMGYTGYAFAVSGDGQVAAGVRGTSPDDAVRWTVSGGVEGLGYLGPAHNTASAWAVDADGSVIVGRSGQLGGTMEAFRWTAAGLQGLGTLSAHTSSWAQGVSADGSVIVGRSLVWPGGSLPTEAFRWTAPGGMVGLGFLPGNTRSAATAVSADGLTIIGGSFGGAPTQSFRWTQAAGMQPLGTLAGTTSCDALGVSGDGSIIVGHCFMGGPTIAFLWTAGGGMRTLQSVLVDDYGLNLSGWQLTSAMAISADGRAIAGDGIRLGGSRAFLAILDQACYPDCNGSSTLTVADFSCFQTKFVAQDAYADCNKSGTFTIADFACFQTAFVAGCP